METFGGTVRASIYSATEGFRGQSQGCAEMQCKAHVLTESCNVLKYAIEYHDMPCQFHGII